MLLVSVYAVHVQTWGVVDGPIADTHFKLNIHIILEAGNALCFTHISAASTVHFQFQEFCGT